MKALAALAVKLTIGMQKLTPIQRFVLVERFRDELLEELERTCAAHDEPEYELVVEERRDHASLAGHPQAPGASGYSFQCANETGWLCRLRSRQERFPRGAAR
jgi:hypothetical protein